MVLEEKKVVLVGRAHADAMKMILELAPGHATYVAWNSGRIETINRSIVGQLPEDLKPVRSVKRRKDGDPVPHDYEAPKPRTKLGNGKSRVAKVTAVKKVIGGRHR